MTTTTKKTLGIFSIASITIAGIFSLRTLPLMATYGLSSISWYLLAAILYFIPSSLICAELASSWPKTGGVYIWIRRAFSPNTGLLAIWLEWVNNVIAMPAGLAFIAALVAYTINPSLLHHKLIMFVMMLSALWLITWLNYAGIKLSARVSSIGLIFGILLPVISLIIVAIIWLLHHHPSHLVINTQQLLPRLDWNQLPFLAGLTLGFAGMQVAGFHAGEAKNPQRDYPLALLLSMLIILILSIGGSLAIAILVPHNHINLISGLLNATQVFLQAIHHSGLLPLVSGCLLMGSIAGINAWMIGPAKGLLAAAQLDDLPKWLSKTNAKGAPTNILLLQAIIGSVLISCSLLLPNLTSFFWLLIAQSAIMTLVMDVLLFSSGIKLRYSEPNQPRPYRIPGKNIGIWVLGSLAITTCMIAIVLGLIPPKQFLAGHDIRYETLLITGIIIFASMPFILRKIQRR